MPAGETTRESRGERALLALAGAAVLLGLALRVAAARGDLWLDELWSQELARAARSSLDVFVSLHHDNNNYLNTLWLRLVGELAPPLAYRALAVAAGLGSVALAALAPLRRGALESALAALLMAGSHFMVHYGSEARGYGPAMFFALAAFLALGRALETGRTPFALAFAASGALGILCHLTFVFVLAAAYVWAGFELVRRRSFRLAQCALLAVPAAAFVVLWLVDVRYQAVGGAPATVLSGILRVLVSATFGMPPGPLELLSLAFLGAAVFALTQLARARDSRAVFFAALYLTPVLSLLAWRPDYAFPRHFAVLVPFTLLLTADGLARVARRGGLWLAAAALALAVFCLGNAVQLGFLLRDGRGHYRDAVSLMLGTGAPAPVSIGSLSDFRVRMVLDDQARRLGAGQRITYVERANLGSHPPQWLVVQDIVERPEGEPALEVGDRRYALAAVFPYGGLSGWSWLLYREVGTAPR